MSTEKYHTYRGDLRALAVADGKLIFATLHPEGHATAVYRLDPEKQTLAADPLPAGGRALLATAEGLWVAGSDKQVYVLSLKGGPSAARGPRLESDPVALAPLSDERLAVAVGSSVRVLARKDGKELQSLELPDAVTCLAADPTGQWLAGGTAKGTVAVFECETDAGTFQQSDAAALHEAAVTALLFEADELRFFSAGADQKLLSTHARGRLEAEDRGRGANHEQPIAALVHGPAGRFYSGGADAMLKSWPPGKGTRPVTQKDEVGKVVALAVVPVHGKPQLVAACDDNSLRFFPLDDEGKFGEPDLRFFGIDGWASNELAAPDPKRREAALRKLAGFADTASVERVAQQMGRDSDHALRLLACQLLGESKVPRAGKLLENGLRHRDEAVRLSAFDGLRRHAGSDALRPLALALKAERADVGQRAVHALEQLAPKDDQAMARLVEALEAKEPEVRRAALAALENVHGTDSPDASLLAMKSTKADVRRLGLLRLHQRKLLHDPRAQAAVRWRGDDADPEVRRVAFLLSLYTREKLVQALRSRDPELNRQLTELESGTLPTLEEKPAPKADRPAATPATPLGAAADIDATVLFARAEELVGLGRLPPQLLAHLKAMAAAPNAAQRGLMRIIAAQVDALSQKSAQPEKPR